MGLDMYLEIERHVGSFMNKELYTELSNVIHSKMMSSHVPMKTDGLGSIKISLSVGYWRKANHIHGWLVENIQDGVDECQRVLVPNETLEELRDICEELLESRDNNKALEMLPPVQGFFFGGYEIDEWYWNDIEHTHTMLDNLLSWLERERDAKTFWDVYYHASW